MSIGGDSDIIGAFAGGFAEAVHGIPNEIIGQGLTYLDGNLLVIVKEFTTRFMKK
jgi:ADP-ribosylglycohydrolase